MNITFRHFQIILHIWRRWQRF